MSECIFCRIVAGELSSQPLYEDASVLAFLDNHPAARGHALVIPKAHVETLEHLTAAEVGPLFVGVQAVMRILQTALKPSGMNVGWNHGWAAGQRVDHLHVHVIPRYAGDGGGGMQSIVHSFVTEDLVSLALQIKAAQ
jgi:histidine triad (HIT) family protein